MPQLVVDVNDGDGVVQQRTQPQDDAGSVAVTRTVRGRFAVTQEAPEGGSLTFQSISEKEGGKMRQRSHSASEASTPTTSGRSSPANGSSAAVNGDRLPSPTASHLEAVGRGVAQETGVGVDFTQSLSRSESYILGLAAKNIRSSNDSSNSSMRGIADSGPTDGNGDGMAATIINNTGSDAIAAVPSTSIGFSDDADADADADEAARSIYFRTPRHRNIQETLFAPFADSDRSSNSSEASTPPPRKARRHSEWRGDGHRRLSMHLEPDKIVKKEKPGSAVSLLDQHSEYLKYNVVREGLGNSSLFRQMYEQGWWHTVIHAGNGTLLFSIFCAYMFVFLLFTPIYYWISDICGLEIGANSGKPFVDALYLSIETMTTIGYGVPDQYYNGCGWGLICVAGQSLIGFMMNAVLFGTVFTRIARAHRRGNAIKFTEKCVIQQVRGRYFLMFQAMDVRNHQCLQVSAKLWCVRHDWESENPCQIVGMRMLQPDDSIGTTLLLATPNMIVHEIDVWSPLHPPKRQVPGDAVGSPLTEYQWPSPMQRLDDSHTANRPAWPCKVCGEVYPTEDVLKKHCGYNVNIEEDFSAHCMFCELTFPDREEMLAHLKSSHPHKNPPSDHELREERPELFFAHSYHFDNAGNAFEQASSSKSQTPKTGTEQEIQGWMTESQPEIIAVISAVDSVTGSSFEAVHSYTVDDLKWNHAFAPCTTRAPQESGDWYVAHGKVTIDLDKFNEVKPFEHIPDATHHDLRQRNVSYASHV